ncbi:polar amino acid ABC transporter inner membrane subunit (plasmid) [Paraburkholderia caffeinilytica]|uniref:Glutamate/aspartate import permease protein GltK n=2 Tax=Paraburkholderia TaxID=1822464 RepID=A0A6J5FJX6_9BURK|nr:MULTISPECIES: amino acid ABC transporter permease [Paraburkholderia]AXL53987.1 polar amino acid ABC transporter inner membrane subunit [Paraburkholderia caffeinilytica]GGC65787.1 ABC transporter permease [Paraburkholderia caffeinilytica]CAB3781701.1 Glutamate/aspartate import permease protein GltK [Paraburkholderia caffeinitolerans]CAB3802037.1 Glutamate/aspartate import permease protein GltK [Paraburkholderia caffeinilytica]
MTTYDFGAIQRALPYLGEGMVFTLKLTFLAFLGGLAIGIVLAVIRHIRVPVLDRIVWAYVTVMRSIPLIMVLFWFFFLVPLALRHFSPVGISVSVSPQLTAFVTYTLFEAAYFCEIIRSGLLSVPRGQYEGAKALGLSTWHAYSLVIVPQALKAVIPIMVTQAIILFQDTSLVYVLSLTDFVGAASKIAQRDGKLVEFYTFAAVVYFVICSGVAELADYLRARRQAKSETRIPAPIVVTAAN